MNRASKTQLLTAAVAGLMGMALTSAQAGHDHDKKGAKGPELVKCYGVNKCSGHGQCGGANHGCGGKNACKGQGWLHMPKQSCESLEGGSMKMMEKPMMKDEMKGEKKP